MRAERTRGLLLGTAAVAIGMTQVTAILTMLPRPALFALGTTATRRTCCLKSWARHGVTHRPTSRILSSSIPMDESSQRPHNRDGATAENVVVPLAGVMGIGSDTQADPRRPRPLLRQCLKYVPSEPGVYIMESADGRKLYIGKSVKLSSRVPTYFSYDSSVGSGSHQAVEGTAAILPGPNLSRRIAVMTTLVERIDYIVTASGAEALMLEASLIQQYKPPFNVLLKDDTRNYPYVCFTWSEPYPRLLITRDRPRVDGGKEDRYYGPFVDPGQVKSTVALVRRVLPLRERRRPLYKDKPCLNYDIGLCPGPCQKLISEEDYGETVRLAEMVFRGQGGELLERLKQRMERASIAEEFEKAGEIKDQMALVRGGLLGSALHFSSGGAVAGGAGLGEGEHGVTSGRAAVAARKDVVAVGLAGDLACFQVFRVKEGRLIGRLGFTYRVEEEGLTRGEVLQACLERYWGDTLASAYSWKDGQVPVSTETSPTYSSLSSSTVSLKAKEVAGVRGDYFVDIPDEIVTADKLPEVEASLLAELLSQAKNTSAHEGCTADVSNAGTGARAETGSGSDRESCGGAESSMGRTTKTKRPTKTKSKLAMSVKIVHDDGKGERHHLCVMVAKNAELEAKRLLRGGEDTLVGLSQLTQMLGLSAPPARIEGFDVSHTGGGQAVASSVSFVEGKVDPRGHRKYRVRTPDVKKGHSDDYASLKEVIARRFSPPARTSRRSTPASGGSAAADAIQADPKPLPDLVLIDGGKGQLAAALEGAAIAVAEWRSLGYFDGVDGNSKSHNGETESGSHSEASMSPVGSISLGDAVRVPAERIPLLSSSSLFSSSSSIRGQKAFDQDDPDVVLLHERASSEEGASVTSLNGGGRDGGRASSIMVDVGGGRKVAFVSLAKKEEELFLPWDPSPLEAAVAAGPTSPGVMLLRQVRDEAHRFALAYHRKLRGKNMFLPQAVGQSATEEGGRGRGNGNLGGFDNIPGLSAKCRAALVDTFGSIEQAKIAGEAELRRIPGVGPKTAKIILE